MTIETDRLILREMAEDDFDALYAVLADSNIMEHYPYTFDEHRVRGWIRKNIAMAYGCHLVDEFEDDTNKITKVYAISRDEWKELKRQKR